MTRKEFIGVYNVGYRDGKIEEYCPNDYDDIFNIEQEPNIDMESKEIKTLQKRAHLEGYHEALKMLVKQEPCAEKDYKRAFYIACDLLIGVNFYGIDADKIFEICMEKDGVVSASSYREYIFNHLNEIDHGEYKESEKINGKREFGFKTVVNSCMICHEPTNDPNPFYICDKCKAKENRCLELIDMYSDREKPLSAENLAEMFLNILKKKPVSIEYIFDMFDKMDKMGD